MNIIQAIFNLVTNSETDLVNRNEVSNRINSAGEALEEYIKDIFANSFGMDELNRLERINDVFCYTGNMSNPPDVMLRNQGDAIEVKKIESPNSALSLNSSHPKQYLSSDSSFISKGCKNAEEWTKRDILYITGVVDKKTKNLKDLCFVYGIDYCADESRYLRIKEEIKKGVTEIPYIEFSETRELGRINRVDPLGITYMRVRGMWGIENPWKVFEYVYKRDHSNKFNFMCIINMSKWNTLNNVDILKILEREYKTFNVKDIKIKNPDNPAELKGAKLITYHIGEAK